MLFCCLLVNHKLSTKPIAKSNSNLVQILISHYFVLRGRKCMKINPEIRHQDLALHVSDQLDFISVSDVRASIIIMNLIMYDGPLLLGLSYILRLDFLWIILPFILIIHLWGIRLVIKNPYSTQLEM